jgi:serine-type D-Ala-D-Ala carboxypeptidase/endopeptidase (penicillin-binding protein 4)
VRRTSSRRSVPPSSAPRAEPRSAGPRAGARWAIAGLLTLGLVAGCSGEAGDRPGGADPAPEVVEPTSAPTSPPIDDPVPAPTEPEVAEPEAPIVPEPPSRPALIGHLDGVLAAAVAAAPELTLGVLVLDEEGREVVAHDPDTPLLPASTLKQVTAAAALTTLGPDARLRTVVDATAGIDEQGRLSGDLIVIGSGDPTLVTEEYARFIYPARPRTPLASLADQLVAAGLTHLAGDVRGTAPRFAAASLPTGWREDYLHSLDGRYGAGLTVDGGLRTLIDLPEVPEDEEDDEDDEERGEDEAEDEEPPPEAPTRRLSIFEQLAALDTDLAPVVRVDLAPDPVLHTVTELTRLLEERGVVVDGAPTVLPAEVATVARLAVVDSPPLAEVLRFTVQRSDNHLADALALAVARIRTGEGSWKGADRAFGQVLARFGVPAEGAAFADGSGLSRDDRVTARLLAELDRRITGDPRFGGTWRSLQAVAGRTGTLDRRLAGSAADGRLLGKTGTLRDVTALTGQVIAQDADPLGPPAVGERHYHLAVLGNDAVGVGPGVVHALVDEVVLALVADLDGCRLVAAGDEDGPLGRPPSVVRCGDG